MWQKRCEKLEENFKARQDAVGVAEQFKEKMQAALQEKNKEIQQLQRHVVSERSSTCVHVGFWAAVCVCVCVCVCVWCVCVCVCV